MTKAMVASLSCTLFATIIGTAYAQQTYENTNCRAGTMAVLAQADDMIVYALDHRGVNISAEPGNPFGDSAQRCIGVVAVIGGKAAGNGWCRNVDPKTGDWYVVDWKTSDKPGTGTYTFRYGTGKWKGVTGDGTYELLAPTKPVDAGTYQNCARIRGTVKVPG